MTSRMSLPVKTFVDYSPPPPPQGLTARTGNPSKGKIGCCHMTSVAFRSTRTELHFLLQVFMLDAVCLI